MNYLLYKQNYAYVLLLLASKICKYMWKRCTGEPKSSERIKNGFSYKILYALCYSSMNEIPSVRMGYDTPIPTHSALGPWRASNGEGGFYYMVCACCFFFFSFSCTSNATQPASIKQIDTLIE